MKKSHFDSFHPVKMTQCVICVHFGKARSSQKKFETDFELKILRVRF